MSQTLYLMLGYPGSGKTYFAKQLAKKIDAVRLNSDHMRNSMFSSPDNYHNPRGYAITFGAIDYSMSEILRAGYSVVYDANNNRYSERQASRKIATDLDAPTIIVWVKTPFDVAVSRGKNRKKTADQIRIVEETVLKHKRNLEEPQASELFVEIDGTKPFDKQYEVFSSSLKRLLDS